jgi:hypothetical protein
MDAAVLAGLLLFYGWLCSESAVSTGSQVFCCLHAYGSLFCVRFVRWKVTGAASRPVADKQLLPSAAACYVLFYRPFCQFGCSTLCYMHMLNMLLFSYVIC